MSDDIIPAKKSLRQETADKIKELDAEYIRESNLKIQKHILGLREYKEAGMIFCFVSTQTEIDTKSLIKDMFRQKKRVCVPRCIGKGIMQAFEIKSLDDLQNGKYGIEEPMSHCGLVEPKDIDFGIIPCVTCDIQGYRLGYGGGFYDRYLKSSGFPAAVVCRSALLREDIPKGRHDLMIDMVVTDGGVYRNGESTESGSE